MTAGQYSQTLDHLTRRVEKAEAQVYELRELRARFAGWYHEEKERRERAEAERDRARDTIDQVFEILSPLTGPADPQVACRNAFALLCTEVESR